MTPTKEPVDIERPSADSANLPARNRQKPESAHLRADAVSLEIPIKVHGSLVSNAALGAAPQAHPFEEQTTTMIVFPQGGVLKMSTSIGAGQVMVLTNLKSNQDAICRVVKVRAFGSGQSYVEVEFTSPQPGYWGVYFPSDGPEVARAAQQQPAAVPPAQAEIPAPPAAPQASPTVPMATSSASDASGSSQQNVPEISWAPAGTMMSRSVKPPEPPIHGDTRQVATITSRPPAPTKLPESSFVSIGAKEEVLAPADSTRTPRATPYSNNATNRQAGADSDISDAIDALFASSVPTASAAPASSPAKPSERMYGTSSIDAATPDVSHPKPSTASATETSAALPIPKQMFGVMLDSATPTAEMPSRGTGNKVWVSISIAAMLALAAGGGYFFLHMRSAGSPAASAPAAPLTQATPPVASQTPEVLPMNPDSVAKQTDVNGASASLSVPHSPNASAASDPGKPDSFDRSSEFAANAAKKGPFTPRRAEGSSAAANETSDSANAQPNVAIPSTFGAMNTRPVINRKASVESAGAAPALDANGSPSLPGGSFSAIAPPPPSVPTPPKPVSTAPVRVGGKILPPRIVSSVLPVYPPIAQQAGVTGTVVVDTIIDKAGNVSKTRVLSGPELLRAAALSALRQWKYEPSKLNGEPISVEMIVSIQFH